MTQPIRKMAIIPDLQDRILTIRGERVILDSDLAAIYGVVTRQPIVFFVDRILATREGQAFLPAAQPETALPL